MKKYSLKEIRDFVRLGLAEDITGAAWDPKYNRCEKIGFSAGTYGINAGLIQDSETGKMYAVTKRNSMLLRIF